MGNVTQMELQPKDSSLFRTAIEGLKDFLPEAHLVVTKEGLVISGMDAAHVGFVKYTLAAADCAVLKVAVPQTLGVSLTILSKLTKVEIYSVFFFELMMPGFIRMVPLASETSSSFFPGNHE